VLDAVEASTATATKKGYRSDWQRLPPGPGAGAPEDALDTACGLYLGDPTAWI